MTGKLSGKRRARKNEYKPGGDIDIFFRFDLGHGGGKASAAWVYFRFVRATFLAVHDICCGAMGNVRGEFVVHGEPCSGFG